MNYFFKKFYLLVFLTLLYFAAFATPHNIRVNLHGLSNQRVLLAHYFANNTKHADDTAQLDAEGKGVFKNNKNLESGIYLVILPDFSNFDFILSNGMQNFEIEANVLKMPGSIKFNGSPENKGFYEYKKAKAAFDSLMHSSQAAINPTNQASVYTYTSPQLSLIRNYNKFKHDLELKNPGTFLALLIHSCFMEENRITDTLDINNFKNTGLLFTPFYEIKVLYFLDRLIPQNPDTVKKKLTTIFNNAFSSNVLYQYLSLMLAKHYRAKPHSEDLFVYVADNYFIPFAADAPQEDREAIYDESTAIKLNIVGNTSPNFYLMKYIPGHFKTEDSSFVRATLYQNQSDNIVVVFMNSNCQNNWQTIQKLTALSNKLKSQRNSILLMIKTPCQDSIRSLQAFAIAEQYNNFIQGYPTSNDYERLFQVDRDPTIYIIDRNRRITARKITWEEIGNYLPEE